MLLQVAGNSVFDNFYEVRIQKNDQETLHSTLNKQLIKLAMNEKYLFFRLNPALSQLLPPQGFGPETKTREGTVP